MHIEPSDPLTEQCIALRDQIRAAFRQARARASRWELSEMPEDWR